MFERRLQIKKNQSDGFLKINISFLIICLIFTYSLLYYPFIFEFYISRQLRISVEGLSLVLLMIINFRHSVINFTCIFWLFCFLIGSQFGVLLGVYSFQEVAFSINKIIFLALITNLLIVSRGALEWGKAVWTNSWFVLALVVIIGYLGNCFGILKFKPLDFYAHVGLESSARYFLHHDFLGNLTPKTLFGYRVARSAGYLLEPGQLGFFCCFNMLVAKDFIRNKKKSRAFAWSNAFAGVFTLSLSFFMILGMCYFFKALLFILRHQFEPKIKVTLLSCSIFCLILASLILLSVDLSINTSINARLISIKTGIELFQENSWISLLFGNGVRISSDIFGRGIDSIWILIIVERGVIVFFVIFLMLANFTAARPEIFLFLFLYGLLFQMIWSPMLLLGVALLYAINFEKRNYGSPSSQDLRMASSDDHRH